MKKKIRKWLMNDIASLEIMPSPGVTIKKGCVVASGSVVSEDCCSNGFYAGVPAKLKRIIEK